MSVSSLEEHLSGPTHNFRFTSAKVLEPDSVTTSGTPGRLRSLLLALNRLFPVIQLAALISIIWAWRVQVPYWDEWNTVDIVRAFDRGKLSWLQLWAPHNEHRIVVPRLVDLMLIELSRWNRQVEMTFDLALASGTACLLYVGLTRTVRSETVRRMMVVPFTLLVFSGAQFANWLAPFQIPFILTSFGVACCVAGFGRSPVRLRDFALALAGATIASFSGFSGLVVWIAFLPGALRSGYGRLTMWIVFATAIFATYFNGLKFTTPIHPTPVLLSSFILAYLGAPVGLGIATFSQALTLTGTGLAAMNLVLARRTLPAPERMLIWTDALLFAMLSALTTGLGRAVYGVGEATESRYQIFASFWWLALLVILAVTWEPVKMRVQHTRGRVSLVILVNRVMVSVILAGLACSNLLGLAEGIEDSRYLMNKQACVVHYKTASNACLKTFYPKPSYVRTQAPYLSSKHLGIFSGTIHP